VKKKKENTTEKEGHPDTEEVAQTTSVQSQHEKYVRGDENNSPGV
jgi:hypothetical protein